MLYFKKPIHLLYSLCYITKETKENNKYFRQIYNTIVLCCINVKNTSFVEIISFTVFLSKYKFLKVHERKTTQQIQSLAERAEIIFVKLLKPRRKLKDTSEKSCVLCRGFSESLKVSDLIEILELNWRACSNLASGSPAIW